MDLSLFCDASDSRPMCQAPFSYDGFTYYTNGHVCVREVGEKADSAESKGIAVSIIVELFSSLDFSIDKHSIALPALPEIKLSSCNHCSGSGKLSLCPECSGSGEVCFENDYNEYEVTCETCYGRGKSPNGETCKCEECNGTGKAEGNAHDAVKVGHLNMRLKYAHKLALLPDVSLGIQKDKFTFIFNSGEGVLMPISLCMR